MQGAKPYQYRIAEGFKQNWAFPLSFAGYSIGCHCIRNADDLVSIGLDMF